MNICPILLCYGAGGYGARVPLMSRPSRCSSQALTAQQRQKSQFQVSGVRYHFGQRRSDVSCSAFIKSQYDCFGIISEPSLNGQNAYSFPSGAGPRYTWF